MRRPADSAWLPAVSAMGPASHRSNRSALRQHAGPKGPLQYRTPSLNWAGVCAFSLTSRITQRDGTTGRDAPGSRTLLYPGDPGPHRPAPPRRSRASGRQPGTPAYPMIPGWRPPPGPGSPGVRRHPAGSPAIPQPGPRARRHPGAPAGLPFTPCAVTLDQLRRQGDGPVRQARRTGTPAHHGNPGRPCRRQKRTTALMMAMYKYSSRLTIRWARNRGCQASKGA